MKIKMSPALIEKDTDYEGGCRHHTYTYHKPDGGLITASGEDGAAVMERLEERFDTWVSEMSAHERLAFLAKTDEVAV